MHLGWKRFAVLGGVFMASAKAVREEESGVFVDSHGNRFKIEVREDDSTEESGASLTEYLRKNHLRKLQETTFYGNPTNIGEVPPGVIEAFDNAADKLGTSKNKVRTRSGDSDDK
jgi:hypothetical protein